MSGLWPVPCSVAHAACAAPPGPHFPQRRAVCTCGTSLAHTAPAAARRHPRRGVSTLERAPARAQHIMIDLGTGNNNKINWAMTDKQEFIDIVEVVYRGARKGRGLVVSPKGARPACACPSAGVAGRERRCRATRAVTHQLHALSSPRRLLDKVPLLGRQAFYCSVFSLFLLCFSLDLVSYATT